MKKPRLSPRAALLLIAALFVLPLAVAWLSYAGIIDYRPGGARNLGALVDPAVAVDLDALAPAEPGRAPAAELARHWGVVHVLPARCDADCTSTVTALRQVYRAAGRNQSRLRILLLRGADSAVDAADLLEIHPGFIVATDADGRMLDELARIAGGGNAAGHTYLLDPLGHIMMHYRAGYDPNDLKADLKRLLTWSKLDEQA